ncbi:MAG: hypothetical protein PF518_17405 [Spirochaetaceae bacterium]|nr:hypothetical protein [Spirochaetaceae bacterium]
MLKKRSNERYLKALEKAKTVFTWNGIEGNNIITVLHGNQQNNDISKEYWSEFIKIDYQIEYLQLFRWGDEGDGPIQLENAISNIEWDKYSCRILAGFSAGCNTILRALNETKVHCDKIILQSPWIPSFEAEPDEIIKKLIEKKIKVLIICGLNDKDCLSQSLIFESKAKESGLECQAIFTEGLGHEYPNDFIEIVSEFI